MVVEEMQPVLGKPAKLKLWCSRGRSSLPLEAERGEMGAEGGGPRRSSALWMKWHRGPYGQKPMVWKVRQSSVLYLGWRLRLRSSWMPWANWHLSPYLHEPFSSKGRHNSVL